MEAFPMLNSFFSSWDFLCSDMQGMWRNRVLSWSKFKVCLGLEGDVRKKKKRQAQHKQRFVLDVGNAVRPEKCWADESHAEVLQKLLPVKSLPGTVFPAIRKTAVTIVSGYHLVI